jgi:hypothetical protein
MCIRDSPKSVSLITFPDYRRVIPYGQSEIDHVGIDVNLLVIMQKVWRALKLGTGQQVWGFTFTGVLDPIKCKPDTSSVDIVEDVSAVLFVIMPCRLD